MVKSFSRLNLYLLKRRIGYKSASQNSYIEVCCNCRAFKEYEGHRYSCIKYNFDTDWLSFCRNFIGVQWTNTQRVEYYKAKAEIWNAFGKLVNICGGKNGVKRAASD